MTCYLATPCKRKEEDEEKRNAHFLGSALFYSEDERLFRKEILLYFLGGEEPLAYCPMSVRASNTLLLH